MVLKVIIIVLFVIRSSWSLCEDATTIESRDACFMEIVLDKASERLNQGGIPFAAMVVNNETSTIACWGGLEDGINSDKYALRKLGRGFHVEESAYLNCTALNPSPTDNQRTDPGWDTGEHILYASAVPCQMGCGHVRFAGYQALVYATDEHKLLRFGLTQSAISCPNAWKSWVTLFGNNDFPPSPDVRRALITQSDRKSVV